MKCILCEKEFEGIGNNPEPLAKNHYPDSRCCDECDCRKVIVKRIINMGYSESYAKSVGELDMAFRQIPKYLKK